MLEKRKSSRCNLNKKAVMKKEGSPAEEVTVLDISMGGMRVLLDNPVEAGSKVSGEFKIVPYLGNFFVQGEVVWNRPAVDEKGRQCGWAVGAKFTKVSTIPIE